MLPAAWMDLSKRVLEPRDYNEIHALKNKHMQDQINSVKLS